MPAVPATRTACLAAAVVAAGLAAPDALALPDEAADAAARHAAVIAHWTDARRAAAIPRDLRIDRRGLGYLRRPDGRLVPYGHGVAALDETPVPRAKPGAGDTTAPSITGASPTPGATVGASATFAATVTDAGGVRSVSFLVTPPGGAEQSFAGTLGGSNLWSVGLSGFSNGNGSWRISARDRAGNTALAGPWTFTVNTGGGGGGGTGTVTNAPWTTEGALQTAAGRIFFEMPSNARRTRWAGYVCSGTVVSDANASSGQADGNGSGRSVILTAAHCVYDDANKAFARNVLFIPDQDRTTAAGTDRTCSNDPLGCWSTRFGVVDVNWTTRTFPDNIPWDYAFYVVADSGAHTPGYLANTPAALDSAATPLGASFGAPQAGAEAHALGYSYSDDPKFMYCKEALDGVSEAPANWWLGSCGLSGGSSGGPWVQPMGTNGSGPVFSVNSWGYTTSPGMAGPKLNGTSAACLFDTARATAFADVAATDGNAGVPKSCP